jgi:hypothetical protein
MSRVIENADLHHHELICTAIAIGPDRHVDELTLCVIAEASGDRPGSPRLN